MSSSNTSLSQRYVDPSAVKENSEHDDQEIATSISVDASVSAFDTWLQHDWLGYKQQALPRVSIE